MKVTVKLLGKLRSHLPAGSGFGETTLEVGAGTTTARVLQTLRLPGDETYLIMVNDERIAAAELGSRVLDEGDTVTIAPPIKGG